MNDEHDIIKLEVKNEFLQREIDALMEEVYLLRANLAEAERKLSSMRVALHIAQHEAQEAKKKLQQPRRGGKFEPDDDVKQALRELAEFNRSGQSRKEQKKHDDR